MGRHQYLAKRVAARSPGRVRRRRPRRRPFWSGAGRRFYRSLFPTRDRSTVYCVTFDAEGEIPNAGLFEEIAASQSCCRLMSSVWLVKTHESAEALCKRLESGLRRDQRLSVIEVKPDFAARLPAMVPAREWIDRHVG